MKPAYRVTLDDNFTTDKLPARPVSPGWNLAQKYGGLSKSKRGRRRWTRHYCLQCGKGFFGVGPQHSSRGKFCSPACRQKAYRQRVKVKSKVKNICKPPAEAS